MNEFKVALTRTYFVTINAENEDDAKCLAEFYLGNFPDLSTKADRDEHKFKIQKTEMVWNEANSVDLETEI